MTAPDVSVVLPVYNTMPYLTRCLDSLVEQSLGLDRIQVIAVDDGSTDGSPEVLDSYAERHPGSFQVVHQANSGGPAEPCNRGLELAGGRYVFFLGADDYLGPEALERLVRAATHWDSDVIFGRMVGVGGRYVDQRMFGAQPSRGRLPQLTAGLCRVQHEAVPPIADRAAPHSVCPRPSGEQ